MFILPPGSLGRIESSGCSPPAWFPGMGSCILMCPSCLVPGDGEILLDVYPPSWFPRGGRGLWLFRSCLGSLLLRVAPDLHFLPKSMSGAQEAVAVWLLEPRAKGFLEKRLSVELLGTFGLP